MQTLNELKVFNKGKVSRKFITMARDAETGNVLGVTGGKGSDCLEMFTSRMKRPKARIKYFRLKIFDLPSTDIRKKL